MYSQPDTKMKIFTNVIAKEPVRVVIQTTTNCIEGNIYIRPEERLKDEMNQTDLFVAVTGATIYDEKHQIIRQCKFLVINRDQIVWIVPEEEEKA